MKIMVYLWLQGEGLILSQIAVAEHDGRLDV